MLLIGWVVYAYKFPNSPSGLFLIEVRIFFSFPNSHIELKGKFYRPIVVFNNFGALSKSVFFSSVILLVVQCKQQMYPLTAVLVTKRDTHPVGTGKVGLVMETVVSTVATGNFSRESRLSHLNESYINDLEMNGNEQK